MQYHVVTHDLVKNFLSDFYMWRLVLDDDTWVHVMVVYDAVASFRCAVEVNLYFVGDKSCRVSFVLGQKMYKMLSYPFFRSECDIFFTQVVKDVVAVVAFCYFYCVLREI